MSCAWSRGAGLLRGLPPILLRGGEEMGTGITNAEKAIKQRRKARVAEIARRASRKQLKLYTGLPSLAEDTAQEKAAWRDKNLRVFREWKEASILAFTEDSVSQEKRSE